MKVKMLTDAPGSPDGVTVNEYFEGEVYDVTESLGNVFVQYGLAEQTDEIAVHEPIEEVPTDKDAQDVADAKSKKVSAPTENK